MKYKLLTLLMCTMINANLRFDAFRFDADVFSPTTSPDYYFNTTEIMVKGSYDEQSKTMKAAIDYKEFDKIKFEKNDSCNLKIKNIQVTQKKHDNNFTYLALRIKNQSFKIALNGRIEIIRKAEANAIMKVIEIYNNSYGKILFNPIFRDSSIMIFEVASIKKILKRIDTINIQMPCTVQFASVFLKKIRDEHSQVRFIPKITDITENDEEIQELRTQFEENEELAKSALTLFNSNLNEEEINPIVNAENHVAGSFSGAHPNGIRIEGKFEIQEISEDEPTGQLVTSTGKRMQNAMQKMPQKDMVFSATQEIENGEQYLTYAHLNEGRQKFLLLQQVERYEWFSRIGVGFHFEGDLSWLGFDSDRFCISLKAAIRVPNIFVKDKRTIARDRNRLLSLIAKDNNVELITSGQNPLAICDK